MEVQFRFEEDEFTTSKLQLHQNTPNPFRQETVIGFELPEASNAILSIYDVSGKLLKRIEADYEKGYNSIFLSNEGLSPGLLYYQLVTPIGTITNKMIHQ